MNKRPFMTLSDLKGHAVSVALASAILFGYGYHNTVDALISTAVWIYLVIIIISVVTVTFFTFAIRNYPDKRNDKEMGKFYKSIADMHTSIGRRLFGFLFVGYWLYALIVQEWTITAVVYLVAFVYMQAFIFLTKDIAKDFFVNQLKGEGITE